MSIIKNIIKWGEVTLPDNDKDNFSRSQVKSIGENPKQITNILPYGFISRAPIGTPSLLFNVNANEEKSVGINIDPKNRKRVNITEVGLENPVAKNFVLCRQSGVTELNGSNFEGLVKIIDFTDKLNDYVTEFNNFVTKHNTHQHPETGTTTGVPLTPATNATSFSKSDYENESVKHGFTSVSGTPSGGGTGITSINGLIASAQIITVGTAGNDFNITSVSDTHTLDLPTASAVSRGALSSADWATFNNKLSDISGQDHSTLTNLSYASAGHTGFEKALTFSTGLTRTGDTITTNDGQIVHNNLNGLQGGVAGQYNHLTNAELGKIHDPVTIADTTSVDLTLTGQQISAVVLPAGVDHNSLLNTHNLTTDIDHNSITNTHNLTTDIDHDQLTNYIAGEHFLQSAITQISNSVSDGILTTASGTLGSITDNSTNWDTAYGWGDHSVEGYLKNIVEDLTPQLGGDLDPNGKKLLGNLDFNYYKSIRMVADNDVIANIPNTGNEVDGQWFYANDAKILYLYEQGWQPMVNFGTVNIYVDGTNGSDATGKGFSVGTGAFASIQYAVDNIPCTVAGDIIINIASGTYSESITVQGKTICGNYTIKFLGTLSELESGTIDSAVDSTTSSLGTLTDTGAFTGDSYQNKLVWIQNIDDTWGAGGDFHYRIIDSHTNDTLTLVGTSTTMSGDWKVYDWLTTIDGLLLAQGGQKSIIVEDIKFTGGEAFEGRTANIGGKDYSSISVRRCKTENVSGYSLRLWYNCVLETYYCYITMGDTAPRGIGLFQWQDIFLSRASKFYGLGTSNGMVHTLGFTAVYQGNTIVENAGTGISTNSDGLLLINLGLFVRNNTTGIRTRQGTVLNTSGINYSGNSVDTDFADEVFGVFTINDILKLEPITSAPTSPVEGYVYYDSTLKKHRGYDGTSWNDFY